MTPEQFLQIAQPLPEATLLVAGTGEILASNRAVEIRLGIAPRTLQGRPLADVVADPAGEVADYLRACSRSRQLVPGSLELLRDNATPLSCRAEGAVVRPKSDTEPALVQLRLLPKDSAVERFILLNQRIDELDREIRRRQQAEERMRLQSERLRVTLASIGDAVIVTDEIGHVTFLNPVAIELTGWGDDALGKPLREVFQIVNEHTGQEVESPVERVLREGKVVGLANHTILISRDGMRRPIDDSGAPIRGSDGDVAGVVLVFRDVTERRQAEQRLDLARARTQMLADAVPALISYIDADARYQLNNRAYEMWFGRAHSDMLGKHLRDVLGENAWRALQPHIEAALAGRLVTYEGEVPYRDGGTRWIQATYTPDFGPDGNVRGLVAHVNDISSRKSVEAALRDSEMRFRQLADAMPQMVWAARPDGSIDYYNERWYQYTGFSREVFGQESWEPILHPDDLQRCVETYFGCIKAETPYQIEYRFKDRSNGGYRWFLGRALPVRDERGKVVRWYGTCTDIDDTKRLQEELKDADRRKDEFRALLAHELRNPLAPIRNGLHIMRLAKGNEQAIEQARAMMERQLGHLVRLVDDLLDVSRISRGKLALKLERLELASVIRSAVETCEPAILERRHTLTLSLPDESILVDADRTRLAQAVFNLLNNAAKYTEPGGRIELRVTTGDDRAVIAIKDSGVGIPPQMLPHVFDMFTQVDRSLEKAQGGLGIGLTIVRRLVEMHGGKVEARSEGDGQGSEFIVSLPIVAGAAAARVSDVAVTPQTSCLKVLVVDDNRDSAYSLATMLRLMGNEVRIAHDGQEALEAAGQLHPDLILMDVGMPVLNGFDATRRIRQQPWGKSVIVVALTGWGQDEDRRKSREAGCDAHLVKPVDPSTLEKLLADLGNARPARAR